MSSLLGSRDLPLWVFWWANRASSWLISPRALLLYYQEPFGCLDRVSWAFVLASYNRMTRLCAILDDRVIRPVGCYDVFFSIYSKTEFALLVLPDILWMVFGHVVVNVTMPDSFSRFNQLWNGSFLWVFIHKENQTKKADQGTPLVPFSPNHFSNQWSSFSQSVVAGYFPPRKTFVETVNLKISLLEVGG